MKRILHIGLLILIGVMAACARHEVPSREEDMLYRVECFFQSNPDTAMQILDTLNVSVLSEKEQAHYCLLKALLIGNSKRYDAEFDSLLQVAENQFIGGNDKYHEAWTYWLIANKTTNMQQPHQFALDAILKALKSIERCRHVDKRLMQFSTKPADEQTVIDDLKYFIHLELGMVYGASIYIADAIPHLRLADAYFTKTGDHYNRMSSAYMLGYAYLGTNEFDSCMMYFEEGLRSAEALGNPNECAYFHQCLASYYNFRVGENHYETEVERQNFLEKALTEANDGLKALSDTSDYGYGYFKQDLLEEISNAYFSMQQYDSCIFYGEQAIEVGMSNDRFFELYNLYKWLYESYKALGDERNAVVYAEHMLTMEHPEANMKDMVMVQEEHDKQEEVQRVESEQQVRRYRLYLWIALLLAVLVVVLCLSFRYRKNKNQEMLQLQEAQRQLQADLAHLTVQQKEMLQQQVMAIYQTGQKDRLERIKGAFEAVYPNALERMKSAYPNLNKTELNLVFLSLFRFRAKEEADILNLSENTVLKYRSLLNKKVDFGQISAWIG